MALMNVLVFGVLMMPQLTVYPDNTSVSGLIPLTDAAQTYTDPVSGHAEACGLYTDHSNAVPIDQLESLIVACHDLVTGGGNIGVVIVGVSNADIEGDQFVADELAIGDLPSDVQLANYSDSGGTMTMILMPTSNYMKDGGKLDGFEAESGIDPNDVRILIFDQPTDMIGTIDANHDGKNDNPRGIPYEDFPALITWQADMTKACIDVLKVRWPNLEIVIITPPTYSAYGGVAYDNPGPVAKRPERMAYWEGFGIRALIQRQIDSETGYRHAEDGFPILVWGPYMWSNGTTPNPAQPWDIAPLLAPLTTEWDDMEPMDGLHPKGDGTGLEVKWSAAMDKYFHTHGGIRLVFNKRN